MEYMERNKALELLQQYNKDPFHLLQAMAATEDEIRAEAADL